MRQRARDDYAPQNLRLRRAQHGGSPTPVAGHELHADDDLQVDLHEYAVNDKKQCREVAEPKEDDREWEERRAWHGPQQLNGRVKHALGLGRPADCATADDGARGADTEARQGAERASNSIGEPGSAEVRFRIAGPAR